MNGYNTVYAGFMRSRLINKLIPFTELQRLAIETVQDQIWSLYQDLKTYTRPSTFWLLVSWFGSSRSEFRRA